MNLLANLMLAAVTYGVSWLVGAPTWAGLLAAWLAYLIGANGIHDHSA